MYQNIFNVFDFIEQCDINLVLGKTQIFDLIEPRIVFFQSLVLEKVKIVTDDIKEQQRGELQAAAIELTNARTNMRQLAMLASQDLANADIYIQQYNQQLTRIHQARRQTQAEVQGDLNAFMEDGREQLADFDAFLISGGIADVYGQKLAIALDSGVPLSINGEGLLA